MSIQLLATFLLFSACVHCAASDILYAQKSTNWKETCIEYECHEKDNGERPCERRAIDASGKRYNRTINMKKIEGKINHFTEINSNGEPLRTFEESHQSGVTKFLTRDLEGKIVRIGCLTKSRKPTKEDETIIKEHCKETSMRAVSNENCE